MAFKRNNLPENASVAIPGEDARLRAPSAARNKKPIRDVVCQLSPQRGKALEIASGTGEHIVELAKSLPDMHWQPTDIDPTRLISIAAWTQDVGLANIADPVELDAARPGWSKTHAQMDLIMVSNLLHLINEAEARTVLREMALALATGGVAIIYGPFLREGAFASENDRSFHHSLVARYPDIGYKTFEQIQQWQRSDGLLPIDLIEMPANNLILAARKPGQS